MNPREAIRLAFAQIRSQKLKSFFSVVGVIIGVMFLIAVISIVEGMNRYMEEDFARTIYGLNTVTVSRTPSVQINTSRELRREWRRRPRLRRDDRRPGPATGRRRRPACRPAAKSARD